MVLLYCKCLNYLKDNFPRFYIEKYDKKIEVNFNNPINSNENLLHDKTQAYENKLQKELIAFEEIPNKEINQIQLGKFSGLILSPTNNNKRENKQLDEALVYSNKDPDPNSPNLSNIYSDISFTSKKHLSLKNLNRLQNTNSYKKEGKKLIFDGNSTESANQAGNYNSNNNGLSYNYQSNFSLSQNCSVDQALYMSNEFTTNGNNLPTYNINEQHSEQFYNFMPKKNFVFFYLEIINFNFCLKDYFRTVYPEINIVLIVEINDCIFSQEKIFFLKSDENTYSPILRKEDLKYLDDNKTNRYRIIRHIEIKEENDPIKISLNFYSFTNQKLLYIGSEDLFIRISSENNFEKFYLYQNIHCKYLSKKVGNLSYNYAYKMDEIYELEIDREISKSLKSFTVSLFFNILNIIYIKKRNLKKINFS